MSDRMDRSERPPIVAVGSWLFAWAGTAFLAGLIIASLTIPVREGIEEVTLTSVEIEAGRIALMGEGCAGCHSRMVREIDRGMGPAATSGFLSSTNFHPGSSRLGPDLQNLARRYPRSLLEIRLDDPQTIQPGTVMPSYINLRESRKTALVAYLLQPVPPIGGLDDVRRLNGIEPAVPDEILRKLEKYTDPATGFIFVPVSDDPEYLITASGIYNSRCAACHGLGGRGDGPASWQRFDGGGHTSVVAPSDFTRPDSAGRSDAYFYWRIMEGVPGTGMPAWEGNLTEDAIWYLVSYVKSFVVPVPESDEFDVEPTEALWEEIPLEPDEEMSFYEDWGTEEQNTENEGEGTDLTDTTGSASGEDGGDVDEESQETTGPVDEGTAGEDSP